MANTIMDLADRLEKVLGHYPLTAETLSRKLGVNDTVTCPTVRRAAAELSYRGVPVCAGRRGFWLAQTPEELELYSLELFGRAYSIQAHADAVRQVARKMREEDRA